MFNLADRTLALIASAACAIFLVLMIVQTVRLEGFGIWPIKIEGAIARGDRLAKDLSSVAVAQKVAAAEQKAVIDAAEAVYKKIAERIDEDALQDERDAMALARQFIAANRVRCPAIGSPSIGADRSAEGASAFDTVGGSGAAIMDEGTRIAVPESDVLICTSNTVKAESAHGWAMEINDLNSD